MKTCRVNIIEGLAASSMMCNKEMDNIHINSSPEEISEFGCSKDMSLTSGSYSIPTIHIPEFELQSKLADNHDITTEAIQALLFS